MNTATEQINLYIAEQVEWKRKVLVRIRQLVHHTNARIEETWRWNSPHFDLDGIMIGLHAHKTFVSVWFHKGALVKDPKKLFEALEKGEDKGIRAYKLNEGDAIDEKGFVDLLKQAIKLNETKVVEAIAKGDVAAFKGLVSDSAWSIDPNGPMSAIDFQKSFAQLKIEPGFTITDSRFVWSDTNTAVHMYKWTGKATFQGQPLPEVTWSSTVWNRRQNRWVAVFHQETVSVVK